MSVSKIGYNITAHTARQEAIIQTLGASRYYECVFENAVEGLAAFLKSIHTEFIRYYIDHDVKIVGESRQHTIVYEFNVQGPFKKKEVKKFIYKKLDTALKEKNFHTQELNNEKQPKRI